MTGLRQPQTTKHLQTLARAGLVTVFPLGQRRVYALEAGPLTGLERRLRRLVEAVETNADERDVVERYLAAIDAESAVADQDRWADGRAFTFDRTFDAPREAVWRHWVDAELLGSWLAPPSMTITECALEPAPGGRAVLDYRDPEGRRYRSAGKVDAATEPKHLAFDLAVLDESGAVSFTGHYDLTLDPVRGGTRLRLGLTITDTSVDAVPYIAGIGTGWGQVLDNLAALIGSSTGTKEAQS